MVRNIFDCDLSKEVIKQTIKASCSGLRDAERGIIEQRYALSFAAEAIYDSTENDKGKYIENTSGYTSTK